MVAKEERIKEAKNQSKKKAVEIKEVIEILEKNKYNVIHISSENTAFTKKKGNPVIDYEKIKLNNKLNNKCHIVWIKFAKLNYSQVSRHDL